MLLENVEGKKIKEIEKNRQYLQCLLKILYFIVTQRWALDSFEPMLDFIADLHPPSIAEYMNTGSFIKYASSTTVTDLLASMNYVLEKQLLEKLQTAPYYALLADESSDEAHKEQFAILVRFPFDKSITDHFLGIIHVERTDAASLMKAIEIFLLAKGVNITKAFFVGFDGCNTMSGENKGLQRRFRHHMPYQIYINCRKHKLALCIKHLMQSFVVLEDVDSLLLSVWKLFHYSPQKYVIFMDVQKAYGMKNLKMIRAAATRWLSHGRACRRLIDRFVQVLDSLDEMIDRKHDPEIEGLRNMLCSKRTVAGILILCDLLEPVIIFSDYLQGANIDFSHVNKKVKDLIDVLYLLIDRFRESLRTPDADLYFSKTSTLFMEIDERTNLRRRLREAGAYEPEQMVEEVAVPITHFLINEIEDAFHCSPVLAAFGAFRLESVPDNIQELKDYKEQAIKTLASHYGRQRVDVFMKHRTLVQPVHTEEAIIQEFEHFKRQMFILKQRNPRPDLYEEMVSDESLHNAFPVMFFLVGLGQIIPASTACVERTFSLMNTLCTASRSRLSQTSLDSVMRICAHNQRNKSLTHDNLNNIIEQFKSMRTRDLEL